MIQFEILHQSKKSNARVGILKTPHGEIETPVFVGVATLATVKTLTSEEAKQTGLQLLIANTYHLHQKPGEALVEKHGGLHKFMQWDRPLMTDSGGFQVLSLGFGKDFGTGKATRKRVREGDIILRGQQPKLLKINDDGVEFTSYVDGKKLFLGPKESIAIQEKLGADIMFAFDECTSPFADYEYTKKSLERTHKWQDVCLDAKKTDQALYGVSQGGKFEDLRREGIGYLSSRSFDGYGIGGEFGDDWNNIFHMMNWMLCELPLEKPRHLLGVGHVEDIEKIVTTGTDTFDCNAPTHYARHGTAFTSRGKIDMTKQNMVDEKGPLDPGCECAVCVMYSIGYIAHLVRAKEITGMHLLSLHNLAYTNACVARVRAAIKSGEI